MGYKLCTAEKPSVAADIAKVIGATQKKNGYYEGNGYLVTWAVGHLVGLAEPETYGFSSQNAMWDWENPTAKEVAMKELPLIPSEFKTIVLQKTKDQFNIVKTLMHRPDVDVIIDCGDSGSEGHILQWFIREKAGCKKPVLRFLTQSYTEIAIIEAMNNLVDAKLFTLKIRGEYCKKKMDWILGMSMSRCCTLLYQSNITVGRVQSPTLFFVLKRFLEVKTFTVTDYYQLAASFQEGFQTFWTKDYDNQISPADKDNEKRLLNLTVAENLVQTIHSGKTGTVTTLETKNKFIDRPQLYDLTSLQKDGNKKFGYTADYTLKIAQSLYEKHKVLSYPRTDSKYITQDVATEFPGLLRMISTQSLYQPVVEKIYNTINLDKKVVNDQEVTDHYALIVTEKINNFDWNRLSLDEKNILNLVICRLLIALSQKYEYKETIVETTMCNGMRFLAKGRIPVSYGWKEIEKELFGKNAEEPEQDKLDLEQVGFPNIYLGQVLNIEKINIVPKKTTPPKFHTEATLLTAMETAGNLLEDTDILKGKGIGTVATRGAIVKMLHDRKYIETFIQGKTNYLIPTKSGINIIKILPKELYSPKITADWEEKIADIAAGKIDEESVLQEFYQYIHHSLDYVKTNKNDGLTFGYTDQVICKCPIPGCSGNIVIRKEGYGCSNYKADNKSCGVYLSNSIAGKKITPETAIDLFTKKKTKLLSGFVSKKTGNKYKAYLLLKNDYTVEVKTPQKTTSTNSGNKFGFLHNS